MTLVSYHGWGLWLIIVVVVERLGVRVGAIIWKLLELGNRCWGKAGPGRLPSSDRIKENNQRYKGALASGGTFKALIYWGWGWSLLQE